MPALPDAVATDWFRCGLQVISCNASTTSQGWVLHHRGSDHWVLSLLLAGSVELRTAHVRLTGEAPISWLCPPATPLQETVTTTSPAEVPINRSLCFNVIRDGDARNPLELLRQPNLVPLSDLRWWREASRFTQREQRGSMSLADRLAARSPADRLLLHWIQAAIAADQHGDHSRAREPTWLQGVLVWVREQVVRRAPTAAEVVEQSGYGRTHCAEAIHRHCGTSISGLVRRERMRHAADLLLRWPEETVATIALRLGYVSSSLFCRHFRQSFGESPQRWRRRTLS